MKFNTLKILFLTLFFNLFTLSANAEVKVAIVDIQWLIDNSPYTAEATKILEQEFKSREEEINEDIRLLREMEDDFRANRSELSEVQLKTRERRIITLDRDIKRAESDFKELLNLRKNEEMFRVQQIIVQAIEQVGERDDFDIILYDSIAYFNNRVSISEDVIDLVKERFQDEQQSQ